MRHTVIHVWTNDCCNKSYDIGDTSSYWGIGDLIRGTIKLYQLSLIMRFDFYVDISLHPISKFLVNPDHPYKDIVLEYRNEIEYFI